jgi:hypothetical protein
MMRGTLPVLWCALVLAAADAAAAQRPTPTELERIEETARREGEAIVALADAAMKGERTPADFSIGWHNDFLKAQQGTFIPFTLTIDGSGVSGRALLVYLRAVSRRAAAVSGARAYPFEDVYPVEATAPAVAPLRIVRGFSLEPGEYDLFVIARERVDPAQPDDRLKAAVLRQPLQVPDFSTAVLTTSSVILADRLTARADALRPEDLAEHPYAIGLSEIQPVSDTRFGRSEELIVVFLVYNPSVTLEKKFDIEVEYHFFRQSAGRGGEAAPGEGTNGRPPARDGEIYFNHTRPQRFTPALMGPGFDPAAGQPVMAGQGVPLAAFPEGEYRLAIRVTDKLSGRSITRDIRFTVVPAPDNGA